MNDGSLSSAVHKPFVSSPAGAACYLLCPALSAIGSFIIALARWQTDWLPDHPGRWWLTGNNRTVQ